MVVGHTIQAQGINSACEGRVYRVDVGLSRGCGDGAPQVMYCPGYYTDSLDRFPVLHTCPHIHPHLTQPYRSQVLEVLRDAQVRRLSEGRAAEDVVPPAGGGREEPASKPAGTTGSWFRDLWGRAGQAA